MDLFDSSSGTTVGRSTLDLFMHSRLASTRSSGLNRQPEEPYNNVKQQLQAFDKYYAIIDNCSQDIVLRHRLMHQRLQQQFKHLMPQSCIYCNNY